eukprot:6155146-Prymnesium_polylepis.1
MGVLQFLVHHSHVPVGPTCEEAREHEFRADIATQGKTGLFARTRLVHLPAVLYGLSLLREQDGPARRRADGVALGLLEFNAPRDRRLQKTLAAACVSWWSPRVR